MKALKVTTIYRYYLRIKFLIDRYRRQLILGVLSLIGTDVTGIALPWLIKEGIDAAVQKKLAGVSLIYFPLLILLAAILQGFFRYCWQHVIQPSVTSRAAAGSAVRPGGSALGWMCCY